MIKHGFILGKFAPFHLGHAFLIQQAQLRCDKLTVLVTSNPEDFIPGWLRYHWVKSSFPSLDVRHVIGMEPGAMDGFLRGIAVGNGLLFESGETQVIRAQSIGFQHVKIDALRSNFPISTETIRQNPPAYWALLPQTVRPHYLKRVALVGPESCGKSYLAEYLARHFNTVFVPEYGRTYCEQFGMDSTPLDFAHTAGGQLYHEDEKALEANRLLFCDTDLIVTQVWSEVYFEGKCQPWIFWANHARRYDLFLLCAPDIPWVNDGLRKFDAQRDWMFDRLEQELESRGLNFEIIRGEFEVRTAAAVRAVEQL